MARKKGRLNVSLVPAIKKLEFATKRMMMSRTIGGQESIFKGRGIEFSDYRSYTPNDDAGLIDWKATARTNQILIREYVEEKNQNIFFMVDSSHKMLFGSTKKLKIEYAVEVICSIATAAVEDGNNVGFAFFDAEVKKRMYPEQGKRQYNIMMGELLKGENYGGEGYDFEKALTFIMGFLEEGSTVVIVSDFFGLRPGWEEPLSMFSKKFDVVVLMIRDPRDTSLPTGVGKVALQDPFSSRQVVIDPDIISDIYEKVMKEKEKELEKSLLKSDVRLLKLETDKDFVKPVIKLFMEGMR